MAAEAIPDPETQATPTGAEDEGTKTQGDQEVGTQTAIHQMVEEAEAAEETPEEGTDRRNGYTTLQP